MGLGFTASDGEIWFRILAQGLGLSDFGGFRARTARVRIECVSPAIVNWIQRLGVCKASTD